MKTETSPELITTGKETTSKKLTIYTIGDWSARYWQNTGKVQLCYGGHARETSKGFLAYQNARNFADFFHSRAYDPGPVILNAGCIADGPRPEWMGPPPPKKKTPEPVARTLAGDVIQPCPSSPA